MSRWTRYAGGVRGSISNSVKRGKSNETSQDLALALEISMTSSETGDEKSRKRVRPSRRNDGPFLARRVSGGAFVADAGHDPTPPLERRLVSLRRLYFHVDAAV